MRAGFPLDEMTVGNPGTRSTSFASTKTEPGHQRPLHHETFLPGAEGILRPAVSAKKGILYIRTSTRPGDEKEIDWYAKIGLVEHLDSDLTFDLRFCHPCLHLAEEESGIAQAIEANALTA